MLREREKPLEFGLLRADRRALPCLFGLDQRPRSAIIAPENVVHETLAPVDGHSLHGKFPVAFLIKRPVRSLEQQVDQAIPRLGFGIVVRVGRRGVGLFRFGNLAVQACPLGSEKKI